MSLFLRNLNRIKTQYDLNWLSPSQRESFDELVNIIRFPGTVNLWGGVGVGKTFLAWVIQRECSVVYVPHVSYLAESVEDNHATVILDNCRTERSFHRDTLNQLQLSGVATAILISRELVQDYTAHVELHCTEEDVNHVRSILAPLGIFTAAETLANLWHLVNPYLLSTSRSST